MTKQVNVYVPDDEWEEIEDLIDWKESSASEWFREAGQLRRELNNDEEMTAD